MMISLFSRSGLENMNFARSIVLFVLVTLSFQFIITAAQQPLEVSLLTKSLSSKKNEGLVKVRVTDAAGKFASKAKVTLLKAYPTGEEDSVLVSNQEFQPVEGDQTTYQFNFLASKPETGSYTLELKVVPTEKKFATIDNTEVTVNVVGTASVSDAKITVSDSEDSQDLAIGKKYKLDVGKKLSETIKVDYSKHLFVDFKVKGQSEKNVEVHQAFVRVSQTQLGREIFVVAQYSPKGYTAHINLKDLAPEFYGQTGNYELELIVGDVSIQNPTAWNFATVHINFPNNTKAEVPRSPFEPLSDIKHVFRSADKRPPTTISFAFTVATLAVPFLILLIGLFRVGANVSNFPGGANFIFAVGFQVSLGAILALFIIYWLRLNMVQTLGYLGILAVPSLFFAHRNLNALSRVKQHVD